MDEACDLSLSLLSDLETGALVVVWILVDLAEFLRGQSMVMIVLAVCYAAFTIAGVDRAIAFDVLTGLLVFAGVLLALPASAALLVGLRHLRMAYFAPPVYGETE